MWVVDMEKKLEDAEQSAKVEKWPKHCIFRVPPRLKVVNGKATTVYKPQTVALGPFHHDDTDLQPMEEHKLRAVGHLLRRAGKTLGDLVGAMEKVAGELEDAYMDLGGEWRGENRGRFLETMITDGCFLLEVMRMAAAKDSNIPVDYAHGDPVFSRHGIQHIKPFVQRDMLMIENQVPLRVLEVIVAVETGQLPDHSWIDGQNDGDINGRVVAFLWSGDPRRRVVGGGLGLHPLDVYRRSLLRRPGQADHHHHHREAGAAAGAEPVDPNTWTAPRSAVKLAAAGIRFRSCDVEHRPLDDICFNRRTRKLEMAVVKLDGSTECRYRNLMAFEAMHVGTGNEVTEFVLFMKDIIDSADDVALLTRKRIVMHDLAGDDEAVVKLFNTLTTDVSKNWDSELCYVRNCMEEYYRNSILLRKMQRYALEQWAVLKNKYFRSAWTSIALLAAIYLLATDTIQTVYGVMNYEVAKETLRQQLNGTKTG